METNNNIKDFNIAEALRYAPKGLKLYSPIFGEVKFEKIDEDNCIVVRDKHNNLRWFYEYGTFFPSDESNFSESECLLFPSVNHRCWQHWQNTLFLESIGSMCVDTITGNKFILGEGGTYFSDNTGGCYSVIIANDLDNYLLNSRYASPEEAKEFFEELDKNGYEWNGKKVVKSTSQPKFKVGDWIANDYCTGKVIALTDDAYLLDSEQGIPFSYEHNAHLWTIQDAKDGDVLACGDKVTDCPFIFHNLTEKQNPRSYCGINTLGEFQVNDENGGFWCYSNEVRPATKEQRDLLFSEMKEEGYKWNVDAKKLIKTTIPIPKFRIDDIIKHKSTGQINTIKYVCSDYYILDNNNALFFESQDMWELAASKVEVTPQDKVPTSLEVYHAVNNIKSLGNKVSILADEIIALKEKLLALEKLAKDSEIRIDALECGGKPFQCSDKAGDNVTLEDMKS